MRFKATIISLVTLLAITLLLSVVIRVDREPQFKIIQGTVEVEK